MTNNIGRIVRGFGESFEILTQDENYVECFVRGNLKHLNLIPLVGDIAVYENQSSGKPAIVEIQKRKNSLIRPPVANLDKLFIVVTPCRPAPSFNTIDKITCAAYANNIEPIIVINKTDLMSADDITQIYEKAKIKIYEVSAYDNRGIENLKSEVNGVCAFAGASGVGKSSLMNSLFPELSLNVGSISRKNLRGKHTTKTVELFKVENGFFADTPGFSLIDFEHFDFLSIEQLPESFPEFREYIGKCRYTDCSHTKESDCAIVQAVENGIISKSRHMSYISIYQTLKGKKLYK